MAGGSAGARRQKFFREHGELSSPEIARALRGEFDEPVRFRDLRAFLTEGGGFERMVAPEPQPDDPPGAARSEFAHSFGVGEAICTVSVLVDWDQDTGDVLRFAVERRMKSVEDDAG